MKLFFYLLLFIAVVAFGLTFSLKNPQLVELNYYPDIIITAPVAMIVFATMLFGMLLGMLTTLLSHMRIKRELAKMRKLNRTLSKELQQLSPLPAKE